MPAEKETSSTSASENRKTTKPIMEKRRRARINASLSELKSLLLEVMKKEGTRHHKMEKADILEMTVKHLRQIQRQQFTAAVASEPAVFNKYHSGFNECASEVSRYLTSVDGIDVNLKTRMLNHLANCIQGVGQQGAAPTSTSVSSSSHTQTSLTLSSGQEPGSPVHIAPRTTGPSQDINNNVIPAVDDANLTVSQGPSSGPDFTTTNANNATKVLNGIPVVPSRLQSGDIAFVIPGNMLTSNQVPGYIIPVYTGGQQGTIQAAMLNSATTALGGLQVTTQQAPTPVVVMPTSTVTSPSSPPQMISPVSATSSPDTTTPSQSQSVVSRGQSPIPPPPSASPSTFKMAAGSQPQDLRTYHMKSPNHDEHIANHVQHNVRPLHAKIQVIQPRVEEENVWRPW